MMTNRKSNKDNINIKNDAYLHSKYTIQYWSVFIFIFVYFRPIGRNSIILIMPEINYFYNRGVTLQILVEKVLKFSHV